ncbi:hypothetical protein C8Q76DRAFT_719630 [Earliella scabrosa]|nr:hypothetical protein C8Q76DRAFT_719630 [Earliella scabrosa]
MSPGSNRKKPVCQKCGHPMAGHKRPYGSPVCPREGSYDSEHCYEPIRASELPDDPPTPTGSPPPPLVAPYIKPRMPSPDFTVKPSASGYWHRSNPNWVDPQPKPPHESPPRHGSWVSTESDSGSHASPARKRNLLPAAPRQPVIDVDALEDPAARRTIDSAEGEAHDAGRGYGAEDTSDTQSNVSSSSSRTILKRMSRGLSTVIGRGTPLASLYGTPREEVTAIAAAAQARGLHTRVLHREHDVKAEPTTPTRTTPAREYSWWVAVGRDRGAVDALVDAQTPRKPTRELPAEDESAALPVDTVEPYDYAQGLVRERNERVGTYPVDPVRIRSTFIDTLIAGAVGGLVMFYCLSAI